MTRVHFFESEKNILKYFIEAVLTLLFALVFRKKKYKF